jgi:hypothetical protein
VIDLYFFDREGNPIPGKVLTQLRVIGGDLSGTAAAGCQRAFIQFTTAYRLGLYDSLTQRVQIDRFTSLLLQVNQGVFTAQATVIPNPGSTGASFFCFPFDEDYTAGTDTEVVDRTLVYEDIWRDAEQVPLNQVMTRLEQSERTPFAQDTPVPILAHPGNTTWFSLDTPRRGNVVSWWGPPNRYGAGPVPTDYAAYWLTRSEPTQNAWKSDSELTAPERALLEARPWIGEYGGLKKPAVVATAFDELGARECVWINGQIVRFGTDVYGLRSACLAVRDGVTVLRICFGDTTDVPTIGDYLMSDVLAVIGTSTLLDNADLMLCEVPPGPAPQPPVMNRQAPFWSSDGSKCAYIWSGDLVTEGVEVQGQHIVEITVAADGAATWQYAQRATFTCAQPTRLDSRTDNATGTDITNLASTGWGVGTTNYTRELSGTISCLRTATWRNHIAVDYRGSDMVWLTDEHTAVTSMSGLGGSDLVVSGTKSAAGTYDVDHSYTAALVGDASEYEYTLNLASRLLMNNAPVRELAYSWSVARNEQYALNIDMTSYVGPYGAPTPTDAVRDASSTVHGDYLYQRRTEGAGDACDHEFMAGDLRGPYVLLLCTTSSFADADQNFDSWMSVGYEDYKYGWTDDVTATNGGSLLVPTSNSAHTMTDPVFARTFEWAGPPSLGQVLRLDMTDGSITALDRRLPYFQEEANRSHLYEFPAGGGAFQHSLSATETNGTITTNHPDKSGFDPISSDWKNGLMANAAQAPRLYFTRKRTGEPVAADQFFDRYASRVETEYDGTVAYNYGATAFGESWTVASEFNFMWDEEAFCRPAPGSLPRALPHFMPDYPNSEAFVLGGAFNATLPTFASVLPPVPAISDNVAFAQCALSPDFKLYYVAATLAPGITTPQAAATYSAWEYEQWTALGGPFDPPLEHPYAASNFPRLAAPVFIGPNPS